MTGLDALRAHERPKDEESGKEKADLEMIDDAIAGSDILKGRTENAHIGQARDLVAQDAAADDSKTGRDRLDRAPGAQDEAAAEIGAADPLHHGEKDGDREEAASQADQEGPGAKGGDGQERPGHDDGGKARQAEEKAEGGDHMRISVARSAEQPSGAEKAQKTARCKERGQKRRRPDTHLEDLGAIGLEENVLHAEGGRADGESGKKALQIGLAPI